MAAPRHHAGRHLRNRPARQPRLTPSARSVAWEALQRVEETQAYANLLLPQLISQARLERRDAALATELTYGSLRWQGSLDAIVSTTLTGSRAFDELAIAAQNAIRLGAYQLLFTRIPPHAAVGETVQLVRKERYAGLVNAVLRRVSEKPLDQWWDVLAGKATGPVQELALRWSHPEWIVRSYQDVLVYAQRDPQEVALWLEEQQQPAPVQVFPIPGLTTVSDVLAQVQLRDPEATVEQHPTIAGSVLLPQGDPARLEAIRTHRAIVQDVGSTLVAQVFQQAATNTTGPVLDICAGPGGKAAVLTPWAQQQGREFVANEVKPHRAALVREHLTHWGEQVSVTEQDGRTGSWPQALFGAILMDAPCSGLGAIRRRPEARWRKHVQDLPTLTALQRDLLAGAATQLRPNGIIGYATCSPHLAETTRMVNSFLKKNPHFERVPVTEYLPPGLVHAVDPAGDLRLWPHVHHSDAMYLALLRKVN